MQKAKAKLTVRAGIKSGGLSQQHNRSVRPV